MLLAVIGGIMDAYSYTVRGGVFATGQTGNLVLVVFGLMNKNYSAMWRAVVPIIAFAVGIFLAQHLLYSVFSKRHIHWKRSVLLMEAVLLFAVGFIPRDTPKLIANTMISFSAAMQFCCFRQYGESLSAYASVFCTGNMRSCAENYYKGIVQKEPGCLKRAFGYTGILGSFFAGACCVVGLSGVFRERAIWLASLLALAAYAAVRVYQVKTEKAAIPARVETASVPSQTEAVPVSEQMEATSVLARMEETVVPAQADPAPDGLTGGSMDDTLM